MILHNMEGSVLPTNTTLRLCRRAIGKVSHLPIKVSMWDRLKAADHGASTHLLPKVESHVMREWHDLFWNHNNVRIFLSLRTGRALRSLLIDMSEVSCSEDHGTWKL